MKLLFLLARRELRFRRQALLPFFLIAAALIFTVTAQITFQESVSAAESAGYMLSPSYGILFAAYALIGFTAAKTVFTLYSEEHLPETAALRALGMKRRHIRRLRLLMGVFCLGGATVIAVPAGLGYMALFVRHCNTVDMSVTNFVPLEYRIPVGNLCIVLLFLLAVMLIGVLCGGVRGGTVFALLRRSSLTAEAENGSGCLPEHGTLTDYGKLCVRRSLKRCLRYNLITVFLLILPVIFLLGASTFRDDTSDYHWTLHVADKNLYDPAQRITEEQLTTLSAIPGVRQVQGIYPVVHDGSPTYTRVRIWQNETADSGTLRKALLLFGDAYALTLEDSCATRTQNNTVSSAYRLYFLTESGVLLAVALYTSSVLLKSRLTSRRRELSLLHRLGARTSAITRAVLPETIADYAVGAGVSVLIGAAGFWGILRDGGGTAALLPIVLLCLLLGIFGTAVQLTCSRRMTAQLLTRQRHEEKERNVP